MNITTKGRLFTVSKELHVHCLECDNTFQETVDPFELACPHCLNTDPQTTVYIQEEDETD